MSRIAVGGTFDPLHAGHKALLAKASELSRRGELLVGLTSNDMVRNKFHDVADYNQRFEDVLGFVRSQGIEPVIVRLDDPYGPSIKEDFDCIVVSPETHPVALKINTIRREKGLIPLIIILVDYVLADDGLPISSTRIKRGEIDANGRVLDKKR
ncbi:MAG: phosphopantetheine adenylyltransferase [Euryarchaeota archaeon]|nr:phosphopantetheine adenylyltransferase [Euryarchaeota archaeon]MBU4138730.1 phosphopantetheine adenylyltransferase [Euryarchaeota archaeon]